MAVSANADCPTIRFNSDNLLKLEDALDEGVEPAVPIEDAATVEAQLDDVTDPDNVVSIAGPITLAPFPGSPSNDYRATFFADSGGGYFVGQRVKITYTLDDGAPLRRDFVVVALVCE